MFLFLSFFVKQTSNGGRVADDASSTSSERYEKDVTVLNRCFDDIERFIARLQHAAAARRELERRRKYVKYFGTSFFQKGFQLYHSLF